MATRAGNQQGGWPAFALRTNAAILRGATSWQRSFSSSAAVAEPSNFQLVAAFPIEDSRASSSVASSRPRDSTILRASCTSIKDYVRPEQIADQILFMCSPRGKTISGQAISICGRHAQSGMRRYWSNPGSIAERWLREYAPYRRSERDRSTTSRSARCRAGRAPARPRARHRATFRTHRAGSRYRRCCPPAGDNAFHVREARVRLSGESEVAPTAPWPKERSRTIARRRPSHRCAMSSASLPAALPQTGQRSPRADNARLPHSRDIWCLRQTASRRPRLGHTIRDVLLPQ
jgi:hypothetical protein